MRVHQSAEGKLVKFVLTKLFHGSVLMYHVSLCRDDGWSVVRGVLVNFIHQVNWQQTRKE